jgi:rhodanese-related sulfurtransferase
MGSEENREQESPEKEGREQESREREPDEQTNGEQESREQEADEQTSGEQEGGPDIGDQPLKPDDARELVARRGAQVLDIRSPDEFADARIAGAVHSTEDDLEEHLEELSKDEPVLVVCADGERSADVAEKLREQGFDAGSVKGGMSGWSSESLPVQPREAEEFHGPARPGPLGS